MHIERFGLLLSLARQRQNKTRKQIAREMKLSVTTLRYWENQRVLPGEDKIYSIQQNYKIERMELITAFENAVKERDTQKETRKNLSKVDRSKQNEKFSGEIESLENMTRMNRGSFVRTLRNSKH